MIPVEATEGFRVASLGAFSVFLFCLSSVFHSVLPTVSVHQLPGMGLGGLPSVARSLSLALFPCLSLLSLSLVLMLANPAVV